MATSHTGLRLSTIQDREWLQSCVLYVVAHNEGETPPSFHEVLPQNATCGTGFLIQRSNNLADVELVTCKHVVENRLTLSIGWRLTNLEWMHVPLLQQQEDGQWAPLWTSHAVQDLVCIKLPRYPEWAALRPLPSWSYISGEEVRNNSLVGDTVQLVGFPESYQYTYKTRYPIFKQGIIAYPPNEDWNGEPKLLIDTTVRFGMSGGLVFCLDQRSTKYVFGIVQGYPGLAASGELPGLCEVLKLRVLWELIGEEFRPVYLSESEIRNIPADGQ